jgi:hypothetical protein
MAHTFCTLLLKETRADAPADVVRDARFWYVEQCKTLAHRPYYWVKAPAGEVVWEGGACCAIEARAHAIEAKSPKGDA